MTQTDKEIIIVGGSLAGLTLALACAAKGIPTRVVERSMGHVVGGDSLSIDLDLVASTVGYDPRQQPILPVVPAYRELTTWPALYNWLRARAVSTAGVILDEGRTVTSVADLGASVLLSFADGSQQSAAAVIGADGYRSVVRQTISPDMPNARYAGYLVWRGLVDETILCRPVAWPSNGGLWIDFVDGYRLVAATLPGRNGSIEPGHRQITFAWFDVHQDNLLRRTGCLSADGYVVGTLTRNKIDQELRSALAAHASRLWPQTWSEAVITGIRAADVLTGAPIAEYKPARLALGNLAIIGDAAHVVSPMTGRGFLTAVEDAAVLAQLLATKGADESERSVLERYEQTRLPFVRGLVNHSVTLSADYRKFAQAES